MAYSISLPFFAFKLHFISGESAYVPLHKSQSFRFKHGIKNIAKSYEKEFQKNIIDKGLYNEILKEWQEGSFTKSGTTVSFAAAKDKFSYPEFDLDFDFYYKEGEKGFWAIVPTLGLEAFAENLIALEDAIEAVIYQNFRKNKRLSEVQGIIAAIWYDATELLEEELNLEIHTLTELEKEDNLKKDKWLPKVAQLLDIKAISTFGRAEEMNRLVRVMKSDLSRNVLLVGASGVGKTALVWELMRRKKENDFRGNIWETTASVLIKELTQETGWQDNIAHLVKELTLSGDILFVRNLLELFEVGKYEGNSVSIAEYLLTPISRGEISIITECTPEEKGIIETRSSNFLSNFQVLTLEEPNEELEEIILNKVNALARRTKTDIEDEAIKETIRLNKRFTPYSGFPGKPIRFLESILLNKKSSEEDSTLEVKRSEVIQHFCEETGMPNFIVDPIIPMSPKKIKIDFNNSVFGQERAVDGVVNMLSMVKTGMSKIGKPIASFLFVGPTGVGKTELAKVLSQFMFGSRDKMIRFDMSEYSGFEAVSKLLGQGFHSDGLLTSTVRRETFCVLLFDEIEKAHPDFFDLLLQMLSEGRLTDSSGKLVNFCSTIIIMTSNIGATAMNRRPIGPEKSNRNQELVERYLKAVQDYFKPEIYNRIDNVIPFNPLTKDTVRYVVEREVELLKTREGIRYRRMDLEIADDVLDHIAEVGYDSRYGARYLQRTMRELLTIPLSKQLNMFSLESQLQVKVTMNNDKIQIDIDADPLGIDLLFEELEKSDYADLASGYRRSIFSYKEGYLYTQLASELEILERDKKQLKEKFWNDRKRAERYPELLTYKGDVTEHIQLIEKLESDYSLSCMGLMTYKSEWSDQLKKWKKDFFNLKIKLLVQSDTKNRHCGIRVYGKDLEQVINFYHEIFKRKEFEVITKTIWYRASLFTETVQVVDKNGRSTYEPREDYHIKDWNEKKSNNLSPDEPKDQLCGVDFLITGDCVNLYFSSDAGDQKWIDADGEENILVSELVELNAPYQKDIHKKSFYERKNLFRIVRPDFLEDKKLEIKRQVIKGNYWDMVIPILDARFELSIELAVQ